MSTSHSGNDRNEWRVFCAIELPDEVREIIRAHIETVRRAVADAHASWSRPENTHLTLKFFGNVEPSIISEISAAAARTVEGLPPFNITIGGTGVFPGASRARVLWIGVIDPGQALGLLAQRFENECAKEGFEKESRVFRPHLTIARLRRPDGSRALANTHLRTTFEEMAIEVKELIIFRSELSSKGSKYTPLSRHALIVR